MLDIVIHIRSHTITHTAYTQSVFTRRKKYIHRYTGVHWAAKLGNVELLSLALRVGGDINAKTFGGYTPLHIAALFNRSALYARLVELGN